MLARLRDAGSFTLGQAVYGQDFLPIRECTQDGNSLYLFTDTTESIDLTASTRDRENPFLSVMFGCVGTIGDLTDDSGVWIRLRCPGHATCEVKSLYRKQSQILLKIIKKEDMDPGGKVLQSWMDGSSFYDSENPACGPYVYIHGTTPASARRIRADFHAPGVLSSNIELVVWLERRDSDAGPREELTRSYSIFVGHYQFLDNDSLPTKAIDYWADAVLVKFSSIGNQETPVTRGIVKSVIRAANGSTAIITIDVPQRKGTYLQQQIQELAEIQLAPSALVRHASSYYFCTFSTVISFKDAAEYKCMDDDFVVIDTFSRGNVDAIPTVRIGDYIVFVPSPRKLAVVFPTLLDPTGLDDLDDAPLDDFTVPDMLGLTSLLQPYISYAEQYEIVSESEIQGARAHD
ncbi:hypothetical protein FB451DRAFT_1182346 [Mycena latifolia]|nr:hypothetical protein FB451DRAFT_1182346 [Mycena latifolia]